MPPGQGWLNAWVKVNSKHVVFPPSNKGDRENHKEGSHQHNAIKSHNSKSASTAFSATTATTMVSEDPETQAIKRFNNRKHKRRLQRSISASDLLRDKRKGKGDRRDGLDAEAALDKSSSTQATSHKNTVSSQTDKEERDTFHSPLHEESNVVSLERDGSLHFVAGFFGTDIDSLSASQIDILPSQSAHYDSASMHHMGPHAHLDAASLVSRGGQSLPAHPSHYKSQLSRVDSSDSGSKGGGIGIRFPPNLFAGDNNLKGQCRHCTKLENELISAREDLEYLRCTALRSEYMCGSCQTEPSKRLDTAGSNNATDHGAMLNEVTARHKAQTEMLTKERVSAFGRKEQANVCSRLSHPDVLYFCAGTMAT
jgi:hypothetical protein